MLDEEVDRLSLRNAKRSNQGQLHCGSHRELKQTKWDTSRLTTLPLAIPAGLSGMAWTLALHLACLGGSQTQLARCRRLPDRPTRLSIRSSKRAAEMKLPSQTLAASATWPMLPASVGKFSSAARPKANECWSRRAHGSNITTSLKVIGPLAQGQWSSEDP